MKTNCLGRNPSPAIHYLGNLGQKSVNLSIPQFPICKLKKILLIVPSPCAYMNIGLICSKHLETLVHSMYCIIDRLNNIYSGNIREWEVSNCEKGI